MAITRGKRREYSTFDTSDGQLQRVYDRLRKRSLRQKQAYVESMQTWDDMGAVFEARIDFYNLKGSDIDVAHQAYVRGVSDALAAVEEG